MLGHIRLKFISPVILLLLSGALFPMSTQADIAGADFTILTSGATTNMGTAFAVGETVLAWGYNTSGDTIHGTSCSPLDGTGAYNRTMDVRLDNSTPYVFQPTSFMCFPGFPDYGYLGNYGYSVWHSVLNTGFPGIDLKQNHTMKVTVSEEATTTPEWWFQVNLQGVNATTTPAGPSSVLFLPGIESSRLYKPRANCIVTSLTDCVDQLWEPNIDRDVQDLFMNSDGASARSDIYTKDVVDSYTGLGNTDIYKTFSTFMDNEVSTNKVAAWKAVPYDWRLGPDAVVNGGVSTNGHISYTATATSSYMVNQVLALASSSPSHKVTIIGHSNGGLVAKMLMNKLVAMGLGGLVDNIVFVGVPQLGTPKAIPAMLHGYDLDNAKGYINTKTTGRNLAKNSPGAYTLLPSAGYFQKVATPTVDIDPNSLTAATLRSYYGQFIDTKSEQDSFLTGSLDQRAEPIAFDTDSPIKLNTDLLTQANALHTTLDTWTAPQGVRTYEIAGVGVGTPSSITYKDSCTFFCLLPHLGYEPNFVVDGDGTVVDASALSGTGKKYYFDLGNFNELATRLSRVNHATIMGAAPITAFLDIALSSTTISSLPTYITTTSPDFSQKKHLIYRIHSPVSLSLYDNQGNHTGIATTTQPDGVVRSYIENNAFGATYDEFGEVKYAFSDGTTPLHIVLNGLASGYVTYDILEMTGNTVTATTTFVNIPVATTTRITMDIQGSIATASNLHIDIDGNGTNEYDLAPKLNDIVTIPKPKLSIIPDNKVIIYGSSLSGLTAHLSGFVAGDTPTNSTTGSASCTTNATVLSPVGTYTTTCSQGTLSSNKYDFVTTTTGTLTIVYKWDGFLQPINDTTYQPTLSKSVFKGGSTVPVKFQLKKADGTLVQASIAPQWLAPQKGTAMSASVDESVYSDPGTTGTAFKYDSTAQQYIYNWSTKGLTAGYWYKLSVKLDDGLLYTVIIGLR